MELDHLWKAERWEPERLIDALQARRRQVFLLPGQPSRQLRQLRFDAITRGTRSTSARRRTSSAPGPGSSAQEGLRFGVSNHSAHAWHWFQTAYGYDPEGAQAGARYDAYTPHQGRRPWHLVGRARSAGALHGPQHRHARRGDDDGRGERVAQPQRSDVDRAAAAAESGLRRPLVPPLPGPDRHATTRTSSTSTTPNCRSARLAWTSRRTTTTSRSPRIGTLDVVLTAKHMTEAHRAGVVEDIERGVATAIRPAPWQTDTCIGDWHYALALRGTPLQDRRRKSSRCSSTSSARTET